MHAGQGPARFVQLATYGKHHRACPCSRASGQQRRCTEPHIKPHDDYEHGSVVSFGGRISPTMRVIWNLGGTPHHPCERTNPKTSSWQDNQSAFRTCMYAMWQTPARQLCDLSLTRILLRFWPSTALDLWPCPAKRFSPSCQTRRTAPHHAASSPVSIALQQRR